jgi:hypothetical protein
MHVYNVSARKIFPFQPLSSPSKLIGPPTLWGPDKMPRCGVVAVVIAAVGIIVHFIILDSNLIFFLL